MKIYNQQEIQKNLENCPHFNSCAQNFCPLDFEFRLRSGGKRDRCRWMREAKVSKIAGREFVSGGAVMPDAPLILVPRENLEYLNQSSQARRRDLDKNGN